MTMTRRAVLGGGLLAVSAAACTTRTTGSAVPDADSTPTAHVPVPAFEPPAFVAARTSPGSVGARFAGQRPTGWGSAMPGIASRFLTAGKEVALTLDACGGPRGAAVDEALLGTLRRLHVPAVLFVNARWIDANPGLVERLAADPLFEIANHGTRHVPLSVSGRAAYGITGTVSAQQAVDEVWDNHTKIAALTGTEPRWFRPGTAHYDDVGVGIVGALGERCLGFTVNGDHGATSSAGAVRAALSSAVPGSIVIAHFNQPQSGTAAGMAQAIPALRSTGYEFVALDERTVV